MAAKLDLSLKQLLLQGTSRPYGKMPAIQCKCIYIKEMQKILEYNFSDKEVTPVKIKKSLHYGLCDKDSAIKATADTEVLKTIGVEMKEGRTYIIKNYGLIPAKGNMPAQLYLKESTIVYNSGAIQVNSEMELKAQQQIEPPSFQVSINAVQDQTRLLSVNGQITSDNMPRAVTVNGGMIPVRDVTIEDEGSAVQVVLWREPALIKLIVGTSVSISHLRGSNSNQYGFKLNSTTHTTIQEITQTERPVELTVLGITRRGEEYFWFTEEADEFSSPVEVVEKWLGTDDEGLIGETLPLTVSVMVIGSKIKSLLTYSGL